MKLFGLLFVLSEVVSTANGHVRGGNIRRDRIIWCDPIYEAQDCPRFWKCSVHTGECYNPAHGPPTTQATTRATAPESTTTKATPTGSAGGTAGAPQVPKDENPIWCDKIYEDIDCPRYWKCSEELGTCYDPRTSTP